MKKRCALISQSGIWILYDDVIFEATAPNYSHKGIKT